MKHHGNGRQPDDEPPANPDAERGLLASLMALPAAMDHPAVVAVQPADFFDPSYRTIHRHLVGAHLAGQTPEVLPARLSAANDYTDDVRAVLMEIIGTGASGSDAAHYAELVRESAQQRKLWQFSRELARQIEDRLPVEDIRGFAEAFFEASAANEQRQDSRPIPLPQLVNLYPELRRSVVAGLLREAEIGNFVSMSKVGKSWLGYGLGLSVVAGQPWLGRFGTTEGRVLLVDNELDVRTIAYRVKTVADAMSIDDTSEFHVHSLRGQLVDIYQLGTFFRQFRPGEYSLVILDALYRFWPAKLSENDNAAVTAVMNIVASYAERMGAAFALVHHSSKGNQAGKNVVDVGAGAAALARAADTHLVLREHEQENAVVLEARTRSFEQPAPMALEWSFPTWQPAEHLDPAALKTSGRSTTTAKPSRLEAILASVRQTLESGPATKNTLRTVAAANGTEINTAVQLLVEAGEIEACEVVTSGGTFSGFQLKVGKVGKVGNSDLYQGRLESSLKGKIPFQPSRGKGSVPTRHSIFDEWNERS